MNKNTVGVITDETIGYCLAQNYAENEISCSLYLRGTEYRARTEQSEFIRNCDAQNISALLDIDALVASVEVPRKLFVISTSNTFSSEITQLLINRLEQDDIIVDLCDNNYKDSIMRYKEMSKLGIHYISAGFTGGIEEARRGLSLLPCGSPEAYENVRTLMEAVSAKQSDFFSCCPYIGPEGSGQYVKMVLSGIRYAILELFAEGIYILRTVLSCENDELIEILHSWNSGETQSYLIEVITDIFSKHDVETGKAYSELVLDSVGFGKSVSWLVAEAAELGVPVPGVQAALNMRFFSVMKNERIASSKLVQPLIIHEISAAEKYAFLSDLKNAVYAGILCVYAQCFSLLRTASDRYSWNLKPLEIAKTLQGGSFIRSYALCRVIEAYERKNNIVNLVNDQMFRRSIEKNSIYLRDMTERSISMGIPVPGLMAAVDYIDCYRTTNLPTGLIQLTRDYLTDAGFERIDKTGLFHAEWSNPDNDIKSAKVDNRD